jgi:phosphatidylglycerol lysyltransferase
MMITLVGFLILLRFRAGRPLKVLGWTLVLPSVRIALMQFALAALDITLATAALFVLLPEISPLQFPAILLAYLIAIISGLVTHAPGGVGVFEIVMVLALPQIDRSSLLAALVVYRVIYFLIPLAAGLTLFLGHEVMTLRRSRLP